MKPKTIVGVLLLGAFAFLVMRSFGEQVGGYMNFAEASTEGARAHVVGTWEQARPATYDPAANTFSFWMRDEAGRVQQVVYHRPKPANFEDAEKVVVDGRFDGERFVAENILIKCPSKYNDARGLEGAPPAQPTAF